MVSFQLDPVNFLSAPGLAWQAALKNAEAKSEFLTDTDMLLMVEKGIRGGICYSTYRCVNDSNKYVDYDKDKGRSYLK